MTDASACACERITRERDEPAARRAGGAQVMTDAGARERITRERAELAAPTTTLAAHKT